jgi:hypothetical protein
MYTDQPKVLAAIRSSRSASATLAATHVRFDGAKIAQRKSPRIPGHFHYFASKLVPQHTRVRIDRVPSGKSMKIASANPDSMNSNQGLSAGGHWAWDLDVDQLARSVQQNSSHDCETSDRPGR